MAQVAPAAVPANAPKEATITPFTPNDDKVVKFIVGKTALEALAAANQKVYLHPGTLAVYVALSSILVGYLRQWPNPQHGWGEYLRPLPIFSAMVLPIIFLVDFIQRDAFEADAQARLKAPDVQALRATYGAPPSGLWLLRLGERFLGLVALDASAAASGTVHVRHLFADEQYRAAHAQDDLLEFALRRAFAEKKIHAVRLSWDPLRSYVGDAAKRVGFHTVPDAPPSKPIGLLRWRRQELEITRKDFERRTGAASDTADSSRTL